MSYDISYLSEETDEVITEGPLLKKAITVIQKHFSDSLGLDSKITPRKVGKDEFLVIDIYAKKTLIGTQRLRLPWYKLASSLGAPEMPTMRLNMQNMIKELKDSVGSNFSFTEDVSQPEGEKGDA